MTEDVAAALAEAYFHGPGKVVSPGGDVAPAGSRGGSGRMPGVPLATLARDGTFGAAVADTVHAALAPRRWEPWNPYNDHRAYPSPRAAHLVDVAIRTDTQRWRVDPVRARLLRAADGPALRGPDLRGMARLELTIHPERLPVGYGPIAAALSRLEAGHVAAALVEAAGAVGLRADCTAAPAGTAAPVATVTLTPGEARVWPMERITAYRSSGIGPNGLSADPRPVPAAALRALVRAEQEPPPGSPARWPGLRHAVAVHRVTGVADGLYLVAGGEAALCARGDATADLQAAFNHPPSEVDVAGMNAVWVMTAAVAGEVRATGPAAYQRLLLTAGAAAQHIATAAAVAGLFCRPVRSVREAMVESAVRAPADHDFVYLLLIGRSRVRDFAYPLTPEGFR